MCPVKGPTLSRMETPLRHNGAIRSEPPPTLYTAPMVAGMLHVNRVTVTRWVEAGLLTPAARLPSGRPLFSADEVARCQAHGPPKRGRPPHEDEEPEAP